MHSVLCITKRFVKYIVCPFGKLYDFNLKNFLCSFIDIYKSNKNFIVITKPN